MTFDLPAVAELLNLDGQRALVTGAGGNIGREIARRLAEAGAEVIVHYFSDSAGAARTVDEIVAAGGVASSAQADLSFEDEARKLLADAGAGISCVVNNAGAYPVSDIHDLGGDEWRAVLAANLDSAFYVTQAAAQQMREQKYCID
jgi:3-oxoacyl-[acyl-carrier protein] reductase